MVARTRDHALVVGTVVGYMDTATPMARAASGPLTAVSFCRRKDDASPPACRPAHEQGLAQGCAFKVIRKLHVHPGLHNACGGEGVGYCGAAV